MAVSWVFPGHLSNAFFFFLRKANSISFFLEFLQDCNPQRVCTANQNQLICSLEESIRQALGKVSRAFTKGAEFKGVGRKEGFLGFFFPSTFMFFNTHKEKRKHLGIPLLHKLEDNFLAPPQAYIQIYIERCELKHQDTSSFLTSKFANEIRAVPIP